MLKALARRALQLSVGQPIALDGPQIFVRHVGAGNAFVVTGNRDRDAIPHVDRQRMIFAAHAQDLIVGRQVDFDQDVTGGHFLEQRDGIVFEHDIDAVPDALSVSTLNRGANVKRQILRLDQTRGDFAGVKRDVNPGIDAVQIVEHGHVPVEVVSGDKPVLGHDKIQADNAGIAGGEFEAEENLGEDAFARHSAKNLIEITDGEAASRFGARCAALQFGTGAGVVFGEGLAGGGGDFFQAAGQQILAHAGEVVVPSQFHAEFRGGVAVGGMHELDVLHVFFRGAIRDAGHRFGGVIFSHRQELVEGSKEMVMGGFVARPPIAHRPGVDDLPVENLIVVGAANRRLGSVFFAGITRSAEQTGSGAVDAKIVGSSPVDHVFGIDRAREVIVQVAPFGHVVQEREQQRGLVADGVEVAGSTLLGCLRSGQGGYGKNG